MNRVSAGPMRLAGRLRRERGDVVRIEGRLAGHVEADGDHRRRAHAAESAKDDAGRLGIVPDVEFGARRDVAGFRIGAAHDDEALDEARQFGLAHDGKRDIGQGPCRDKNEPPGVRTGRRDDGVDGVGGARGLGRLGQHGMAEAALAVDVPRVRRGGRQRARRARPHGNVAPSRERQHRPRIAGRRRQRSTLPTTVETPRISRRRRARRRKAARARRRFRCRRR